MAKSVLYASSGTSNAIIQGPGNTYFPFGGAMNPLPISFGTPPPIQCAGDIAKGFIYVFGNTTSVNNHMKMTLDSVLQNINIIIPAGQSGLFIDDSNTFTIPDDDAHFINYVYSMDTGAVNPFRNINFGVYGCLFTAANGHSVSRLGNWTAFPNLIGAQPAGTTMYLSVVGNPERYFDPASANFHINFTGTLSKFAFNPGNYLNTLNADANAILQKNGIDTSVNILIPQGGSAIYLYDNITSISCIAGDYFRWKIVTGGTTGSLQVAGSAFNVDNVSGYSCNGSYGATRTFSFPNISYPNISGYITDGTLNEWPLYARTKTIFSGLGTQVIANNNAGNAYLRSYINGAELGNQIALIPPLSIGHFIDDSNIDTLEDGDNIQGQMDMSAAGNINIQITVIDFTPFTGTITNSNSGIYKIIPESGKSNDTIWDDQFTGTTRVKIPDPFARLVGVGE